VRQDNPARLVATAPTLRTPMHHAGLHKFKGYSALVEKYDYHIFIRIIDDLRMYSYGVRAY